jgi:hypothetical protein
MMSYSSAQRIRDVQRELREMQGRLAELVIELTSIVEEDD